MPACRFHACFSGFGFVGIQKSNKLFCVPKGFGVKPVVINDLCFAHIRSRFCNCSVSIDWNQSVAVLNNLCGYFVNSSLFMPGIDVTIRIVRSLIPSCSKNFISRSVSLIICSFPFHFFVSSVTVRAYYKGQPIPLEFGSSQLG